jgi:cellulose synthase/poly-beta-1,6-N-acetylglucosamine synthase-like glycosyltransferase
MIFFLFLYIFVFFGMISHAYSSYEQRYHRYYTFGNLKNSTLAFLIRSYRPHTFWWESIHLAKRVTIISASVFLLAYEQNLMYMLMLFILLGFLFLDIIAFPFEKKSMLECYCIINSYCRWLCI